MAMINPTVSVIIPAYTMERWGLLQEAVASACDQTAPPIEVIIPIDNNKELLEVAQEEWPSTRTGAAVPVRVVPSEFHHDERDLVAHLRAHGAKRRFGAGYARNTAAQEAQGEILAFLDDDAAAEAMQASCAKARLGADDCAGDVHRARVDRPPTLCGDARGPLVVGPNVGGDRDGAGPGA